MSRSDLAAVIITVNARGTDPKGLMQYLAGRGKANEHTNQRIIAGSCEVPGPLDSKLAAQLAHDIRMPSELNTDVTVKGGNIYHVVLSVNADEGQLPDDKWRGLAEDYMREMGFTDPSKAEVRWTAVNHGLSTNGNDHVHIVMNLVRMDGTKVDTFRDMPRSQVVATRLEQKYGLNVLQSRLVSAGAGTPGYSHEEAGVAARTEMPVQRVELERHIRAALAASTSEAEFVRRIRAAGVVVRPYPVDKGPVTGYSVGLPSVDGSRTRFFQASQVARDLSLPRVRAALPEAGSKVQAAAEWRVGTAEKPVQTGGRETHAVSVGGAVQESVDVEIRALEARIRAATPASFGAVSGELSGVLAAASKAIEGDRPGELAAASREVGSYSQTRVPAKRPRKFNKGLSLLLMQAMDPTSPMGQAIMWRQVAGALIALQRLHQTQRRVAVNGGKGLKMDGLDDSVEGLATVAVTVAAAGMQQRAENRTRAAEQVERAGGVGVASSERGSRLPAEDDLGWVVPEDVAGAEYAGMSADQVAQVQPDVYANDYQGTTEGALFAATEDQQKRVAVLSSAIGIPSLGEGADEYTRQEAAKLLREMETRLGPDAARGVLLGAGLSHRDDSVPDAPVWSYPQTEPAVRPGTPAAAVAREKSPLDWKDAGNPVTKNQTYRLSHDMGLTAEEIGKLDKGHASLVVDALLKDSPAKAREVYDIQVAAMGAVIGGAANAARPNQPPPVQRGPEAGHSR